METNITVRDFINNPVITGNFKPKFYWTGNVIVDAERINRPHIKAEGENENRIQDTIDIINELDNVPYITLEDALNIQNRLLKSNNWKGIIAGLRLHDVSILKPEADLEVTPSPNKVKELINDMFPVASMPKEQLLEWYAQVQMIHPLSDLNGRVFGIIVSILNMNNKK